MFMITQYNSRQSEENYANEKLRHVLQVFAEKQNQSEEFTMVVVGDTRALYLWHNCPTSVSTWGVECKPAVSAVCFSILATNYKKRKERGVVQLTAEC